MKQSIFLDVDDAKHQTLFASLLLILLHHTILDLQAHRKVVQLSPLHFHLLHSYVHCCEKYSIKDTGKQSELGLFINEVCCCDLKNP